MNITIERHHSINHSDLQDLAGEQPSMCVSIFIPTHRAGTEVQQDPIRLKNAVRDARNQLQEHGLEEELIESLLEPAIDLAQEDASSEFWQHQSDGLALLLNDSEARIYQLPISFEEYVQVSHRFSLKPLIRAVTCNELFHVVAVSRNDVRVFHGCAAGLTQERSDDLPSGIEEVTTDDQQRGHNRHSFRVRANNNDSSVPHGHVDYSEDADLKQYFREIKDAIGDHMKTHDGPVVFAGVDELLPYFKEEFDCCDVLDEAASGNADHLGVSDLHDKTWPMVQKQICDSTSESLDRYQEAAGTDYGVTDLECILKAASVGQIDTLFVKTDVYNYGTCDDHGMVETSDQMSSAENYDLCDVAAIRTLRADGNVVFVKEGQLESPVAAILRFVS